MKGFALATIPAVLLLSACDMLESNEVRIRNDGPVPLSDVAMDVGGQRVHVGVIAPGAVARVGFEPESDSGIQVTYRLGQPPALRSCDGDVYVTTGARQQFVARVDAAGRCRLSEFD